MSKRFTDTDKWKDEWFLELEPMMKMLWLYILDTCDHAGIWKVNFKLASYCIGGAYDKQSALKALQKSIVVITEDKWHIPKFISYQYKGKLNPDNKAHKGVISQLILNHIDPSPFQAPLKLLRSEGTSEDSCTGVGTGIGVGIGTGKDLENTIAASETVGLKMIRITPDEVVDIWNQSMAREGFKSIPSLGSGDHLRNCIEAIKWLPTGEDWVRLFAKVKASKFLSGENQRNWIMPLTWVINYDNALRVLASEFEDGCSDPFANMKSKDVPA